MIVNDLLPSKELIVLDRLRPIPDKLHDDLAYNDVFKNSLRSYSDMVVPLRKRHGEIRS